MREIITKTTVYNFSELSPEAKKKAIESWINDEETLRTNSEDFSEFARSWYRDVYGIEIEPNFTLSHCQGDGFRFECLELLSDKFIKRVLELELTKEELRTLKILKSYGYNVGANNAGRYNYATKYDIDAFGGTFAFEDYKVDYPSTRKTKEWFDDLEFKVSDIIRTWYLDECHYMEKIGYKSIWHNPSEEEFEGLAGLNEWEFLEDGGRY